MIKLLSFILTGLILVFYNVQQVSAFLQPALVSERDGPPSPTKECPVDLTTTCNLRCTNGNYVLDTQGCPTCACASAKSKDVVSKPRVECSRVMCRMYCLHGFRRDENGCEICKCNESPQPCPQVNCQNTCANGYRKDYSGCQTCQCECPATTCSNSCANGFGKDENGCLTCTCKDDASKKIIDDNGCSAMTTCDLVCKYDYERDLSGCQLCSCNRCPLRTCRMFCMYGFKKNSEGCDVCECDWTPVAEKLQCSARIPCTGSRVCNLNLNLCESVSAEKVNWFLYDFDIDTELFNDTKFVTTFKNGLINNIASKYDLEPGQITVSAVENNGLTSFQVMPYFVEDMDGFQKKMDQIDIDLNSQEFRTVLPAVARRIEKDTNKPNRSLWERYVQNNPRCVLYIIALLIGLVAVIFAGVFVLIFRHRMKHPRRSESKSPIFDTPYHQAPTEDDQYHAIHAPDGTAYVVVESEDMQAPNDKRALV